MQQNATAKAGPPPFSFPELKTFLILWAGQMVSGLGSGLTSFAIPVWIYQETDSIEQFGALFFAGMVPGILLAPFAGPLVDRWDRRKVMIASDVGAALMTAVIAVLFWTEQFRVEYLFGVVVFGSVLGSFQQPAFQASVALLVPQRQFGRASGFMQTAASVTGMITPLLAGVLMGLIGIKGILVIDFVTFFAAMGTLLAIRIPAPPPIPVGMPGATSTLDPEAGIFARLAHLAGSLGREALDGFRYITQRGGLFGLLLYFAVFNFGMGTVTVLLQPMILELTSVEMLGVIASMVSLGSLIGGIGMGVWGGGERKINGIFAGGLVVSLCLMLAGLRADPTLIGLALFGVMLVSPIIIGCSQAIWMAKIEPAIQGRVFATRRMIAMSALPLAVLAAPVLAERFFQPLLMPDGALAGSVGAVIGVGDDRGIGFMYILVGGAMVLLTLGTWLSPRIRNVEEELPDVAGPQGMPAGAMPGAPGGMPRPAPAPAGAPAGAPPARPAPDDEPAPAASESPAGR